jgi:hypothetical protein
MLGYVNYEVRKGTKGGRERETAREREGERERKAKKQFKKPSSIKSYVLK